MKKITIFTFGVMLLGGIMASCSGGNAEKEREDSMRTADSLAAIEADLQQIEQARLDSIRQDSINNASAGLTFEMFTCPEKIEGVTLTTFLTLKKIKSNLEGLGFEQTGSQNKKEKDYDWTPDNPTYYTKNTTTFAKTIGSNTTKVEVEGSEGYVSEVDIEFPNEAQVAEFKSTVKGKLKDSNVYWHAMEIKYKGNKVEIELAGGE